MSENQQGPTSGFDGGNYPPPAVPSPSPPPSWNPPQSPPPPPPPLSDWNPAGGYGAPPASNTGFGGAQNNYGSFLMRLVAFILDSLIIGIPLSILGFIVSKIAGNLALDLFDLVEIVAVAAYFVYFWSQPAQDLGGITVGAGQTPAMSLLKLRVVSVDGSPLDVGKAIVRYLMFIPSTCACFLGFLWAAWDPQHQGWHDKVAGTYVVSIE